MMQIARFAIVLSGFVVLGCGQKVPLGQVDGTVRARGKPLPSVVVRFVPDQASQTKLPQSVAQTDDQGRYRLKTEQQEDGAVVGKHRVTVEDLAILSAPRSADGTVLQRPPVRFPADYSDPLRTPLQREVKAGTQTLDLDLTP